MVGFDTPETYQPRCDAEKRLGQQAKGALEKLLRTAHQIDFKRTGIDKYGRVLARVYVDGVYIAKPMIAQGLGPLRWGQAQELETSSIRVKMTQKNDNPADPFKKALAEATKVMAHDAELTVSFTVDPSGVGRQHAPSNQPSHDQTRGFGCARHGGRLGAVSSLS